MRGTEQVDAPTSVSVIIPAHNEAGTIQATIKAALGMPGVTEVVVVDDGSTDGTEELARQAGATILLRHSRNLGKGAALQTGWRASHGDVLLLLDADLGSSAAEGTKLLQPVLSGAADATIARFPRSARGGGLGLALRLARWGVRRLTGVSVEFPLSGQRAIKRCVLEDIGGFSHRFAVETGMTVDLLRRGYRVLEVDTAMSHRLTGRNVAGFVHRGRQLLNIAGVLARKAFTR